MRHYYQNLYLKLQVNYTNSMPTSKTLLRLLRNHDDQLESDTEIILNE